MRDHWLAPAPLKWEPLTELCELNALRDLVSALLTHCHCRACKVARCVHTCRCVHISRCVHACRCVHVGVNICTAGGVTGSN